MRGMGRVETRLRASRRIIAALKSGHQQDADPPHPEKTLSAKVIFSAR